MTTIHLSRLARLGAGFVAAAVAALALAAPVAPAAPAAPAPSARLADPPSRGTTAVHLYARTAEDEGRLEGGSR